MTRGIPARKPIGSTGGHSAQPQPPRPRGSISTMTLSGVQRPPGPARANVAHSRAMSVPSSTAFTRTQSQSQRNKPMATQTVPSSSRVSAAGTSGLRRPSSLRAPTSRAGASGIAVLRASSGVGASGARRVSMSTSMAVESSGSGGGRLGLTGANNKMGPVKGEAHGQSTSSRMMRRV
jgi:hypothetical protein